MANVGHFYTQEGQSGFRIFAPAKTSVGVVLLAQDRTLVLTPDALGYWTGACERLAPGTRYLIEIDGARYPDIASRAQPDGVHGASMIVAPSPAARSGWTGVRIEDAIIYELHFGHLLARRHARRRERAARVSA